MKNPLKLNILAAVGIGLSAAVGALAAGPVAAVLAGLGAAVSGFAMLMHERPVRTGKTPPQGAAPVGPNEEVTPDMHVPKDKQRPGVL